MVDNKNIETPAPFNLALATLERINKILINFSSISLSVPDDVERCLLKKKMVKQLYIASVPLIMKRDKKLALKKQVDGLDSLFKKNYNQVEKTSKITCRLNTEDRIDIVCMMIQEVLQEKNYFMPPGNDPRYGWDK